MKDIQSIQVQSEIHKMINDELKLYEIKVDRNHLIIGPFTENEQYLLKLFAEFDNG
jgi:hypothetical protein